MKKSTRRKFHPMTYALTDHRGNVVAEARSRAAAYRASRTAGHLGADVNRASPLRRLRWLRDADGTTWARFATDDARRYSHKYRIGRLGPSEWIVRLETPSGTSTVDAGRTIADAKRLAQAHMDGIGSANRADDGDPQPWQIILEQMGGAGRIRSMIGASLSRSDDGNRLDIQFPNRMRSKANFVQVRYDPGPDTYTMTFWRMDRMGAGKKLREVEGVYSDSLVEVFERETGLYLRM